MEDVMKFNYKTCSPAHSRFSTNAQFLSCCGKARFRMNGAKESRQL